MHVRAARVFSLALVTGLALAACDQDERSALHARAIKLAEDARTATRDQTRRVEQETRVAANEAKQTLKRAGDAAFQIAGDAAIAARVKAALVAEKNVKSTDIRVEAFQGRVILRGTVPDEAQIALAGDVARMADGARSVDNRLAVH